MFGIVGHDRVVDLGIHRLDNSIDEVAEVFKELVVVARNETIPFELAITCLWSMGKEVVTPDIGGNASFFCIGAKGTDTARLGEFAVLIVKIFGSGDVVRHSPFVACAELRSREDNGVEWDIIFPHKLIKLHLLGVSPPFPPLFGISCGD